MSMSRKLFRPKPGNVPARFAAFRMNGTVAYRGDTVLIDTTAPTDQGASGVLDGATMTALQDYIYVSGYAAIATVGATIGHYKVAGVIEGRTIGDRNTTTALDNDGVVIVQVAGVHHNVWMTATDGVADWVALACSNNTLGSALAAVGIGVTTDAARMGSYLVGSILGAYTAGTRGTVTTASFNPVWIRCGDVI